MFSRAWELLASAWQFLTFDSLAFQLAYSFLGFVFVLAGATWVWLNLVQWLCGRKGHETESEVVQLGVCHREVCKNCGKVVFAGPYDPDPEY